MPSTNQLLQDAAQRHQLFVDRYAAGSTRRAIALLTKADEELEAKLAARLARLGPIDRQEFGKGLATTRRNKEMLRQIREQNAEMTRELKKSVRKDLSDLAKLEIDIEAKRLTEAVGFDFGVLKPPPTLLTAAVNGPLARRQTLNTWFKRFSDRRFLQIDSAVKLGMVQGESNLQIIRRIRQGRRQTRANVAALVNTNTNTLANQARGLLHKENEDVIKGERWLSARDGDVSPICRALDGQVFPIGEGPRPSAHPNCRSVMVPVVREWDELAKPGALKPGRGARDIDKLFRQRLKARGFSDEQIKSIRRDTRASVNGQVPRKQSHADWLRGQPKEFRIAALGRTKERLFTEGELPLSKMVNMQTGRPLSIAELRRTEAKAFMRADI